MFDYVAAGDSPHFTLRPERLDDTATYVAGVIRDNHPDLRVPFHSRWRHFAAGGRDRWGALARRLPAGDPLEAARVRFDLACASVLTDAGAGAAWRYVEPASGAIFTRSEGLAVAGFDLFASGALSSDPARPLQADAAGLMAFDAGRLAEAFQSRPGNALVGATERADILARLGAALEAAPDLFGAAPARFGRLVDYLTEEAGPGGVAAADILAAVLRGLAPVWPSRAVIGDAPLGDVWPHPAAGGHGPSAGLVPFHKLSQWLTYSLVEPLEEAGIPVTGVDGLTGLAEYRNGGLFIDSGAIVPRDPALGRTPLTVAREEIVEWRALTVTLIDRIAPLVRDRLGLDAAALPLPALLEGGTWAAGRRLAAERRDGAAPPLAIASDGTVF